MKDLFKFFNSILVNALVASMAVSSFAFVPHVSQIGRFQPTLLSRQRAMSSTGHLEFQGNKLNYVLDWYGPENYQIRISQISPSVYSQGQGASTWELTRRASSCVLKAGALIVNCPSAHSWGLVELSGSPEATAQGLFSAELLEAHEIPLQETDSQLSLSPHSTEERVQLVVSRDGPSPVAQLEIIGSKASSNAEGEVYPLMRFDQSFLAPTFLRIKQGGEIYTVEAESDLEIKKDRTRFTWVLAKTLNVQSEIQQSLRIVRSEPQPNSRLANLYPEKSLSQVDTLKNTLSVPGLFLLEALLITH